MHFALLYICAATSKKFVTFLISTGAKKSKGPGGFPILFFTFLWPNLNFTAVKATYFASAMHRSLPTNILDKLSTSSFKQALAPSLI